MENNTIKAQINTNRGTINLYLFFDEAPITVSNFVNLSNREFYNNLTFHRVINDFMIQGGCPIGNGTGGPGYEFEDEFHPSKKHNRPGILSMANSGPNTNGSQFFITHVETPWLNNHHTVFGVVQDENDQIVVNSISQGDVIESINIIGSFPTEDKNIDNKINQWDKFLDN